MATYLELCQAVARESGTVPNIGDPQTTANQTGRLLRICQYVRMAYDDIQRRHSGWRWMHGDFTGTTIAGTQRYDAAGLGIASRFLRWRHRGEDGDSSFSLYLPADGQETEGMLVFTEWEDFRRNFLTQGNATRQGKPWRFTVTPANEIALWPTPDAAYTVRGLYLKAPQTLAADSDVPEMPATYHDAITWQALIYLGTFDEAFQQTQIWNSFFLRILQELEHDQLPHIRLTGPLA